MWMRLEDICTVFTDGDWIESKDQADEGIRLIQTGNIGMGAYLEKEEKAKYISEETFNKLKCTEIFSGDILVSRLPEPVGRACIIPEKKERMITAVDCTIVRILFLAKPYRDATIIVITINPEKLCALAEVSMITNFDYLKNEPKFSAFANVAISAEKIILMDPEASIINSRRAMEFAIKWMYSVDKALEMPYQDNLQSLMNEEEYRQLVGADLWRRMDYIRRCGNNVAHGNKKLGRDEAMLCLENLFIFLDYIAHCYTENSTERTFDKNTITARMEKARESKVAAKNIREELEKEQEKSARQELDLKKLIAENASLREELSARRQEQQQTYVPKPLDLSEYKTRKL